MRKAAAQRDVHHLGIVQALEQLAARALEADVAQGRGGRLAEKTAELPLQRPARHAGDGSQVGHAPAALYIGAHGIERSPHAARQGGCARDFVGSFKHCGHARTLPALKAEDCELCHTLDSGVANWIGTAQGPTLVSAGNAGFASIQEQAMAGLVAVLYGIAAYAVFLGSLLYAIGF